MFEETLHIVFHDYFCKQRERKISIYDKVKKIIYTLQNELTV